MTDSSTGTFSDKNVGNGKTVTLSRHPISGTDAGNYTFTDHATHDGQHHGEGATIGGITAANKVYDGDHRRDSGGSRQPDLGNVFTDSDTDGDLRRPERGYRQDGQRQRHRDQRNRREQLQPEHDHVDDGQHRRSRSQ